jgi:hypothetical protein
MIRPWIQHIRLLLDTLRSASVRDWLLLQNRIKCNVDDITDQFAIKIILLAAMDNVRPDDFLQTLSAVDQQKPKRSITLAGYEQARFYWIFKNVDFEEWWSASSAMLWLSGPPRCGIQQATVHIINLAKKKAIGRRHSVLYFFCSTVARARSAVTDFVRTIFHQIVSHLPAPNKKTVITAFLFFLLEAVLSRDPACLSSQCQHMEHDLIKKLLDLSSDSEHMDALKAALEIEKEQELSIIVCGLDEVVNQKREFIQTVYAFLAYLQERTSSVKVLTTSCLEDEIQTLFGEMPSIEYDKERKGSTAIFSESYTRLV